MSYRKIIKELVNLNLEKKFYEYNIGEIINQKSYKKPKKAKPHETSLRAGQSAFEPECPDLTRLYSIIRMRKIITVLELGSGQSTIVIGEALKKNKKEFKDDISLIRRQNPFHLYSLESEKKYAREVKKNCNKKNLKEFISILEIGAEQTSFRGMICGKYKRIPSVCPDLIYIDGPMPMSYINSKKEFIDMHHPDITNITCDLLIIEPLLLPGTIVIIDGMTNNARFNRRNLQRNWISIEDLKNDYTIMILDEPTLGIHHTNQIKFQNS